jgi:hypothetical protein
MALPADKDAARVDALDLPAKDRSPLSHIQSGLESFHVNIMIIGHPTEQL